MFGILCFVDGVCFVFCFNFFLFDSFSHLMCPPFISIKRAEGREARGVRITPQRKKVSWAQM